MGKGLGRGMGKGKDGCIFGELAKGLQCVLCLLCCICISGPILIVVGIGYLGRRSSLNVQPEAAAWHLHVVVLLPP